jgi:beta-glucosidase
MINLQGTHLAAFRATVAGAHAKSMVLLKSEGGVLRLSSSVKTVAVIGPHAASLAALEGNYNAVWSDPASPLNGMRAAFTGAVASAIGVSR